MLWTYLLTVMRTQQRSEHVPQRLIYEGSLHNQNTRRSADAGGLPTIPLICHNIHWKSRHGHIRARIQHLGDLRTLSEHNKHREPTNEEVDELLAGVSKLLKTAH
jgi:hypothetical protein